MPHAISHGTEREGRAFVHAIEHNCTCPAARPIGRVCAVHEMAALDQRAVDGLVFVRRFVDRYLRAEWVVTSRHDLVSQGNETGPESDALRQLPRP
jgi:hypothetical protein